MNKLFPQQNYDAIFYLEKRFFKENFKEFFNKNPNIQTLKLQIGVDCERAEFMSWPVYDNFALNDDEVDGDFEWDEMYKDAYNSLPDFENSHILLAIFTLLTEGNIGWKDLFINVHRDEKIEYFENKIDR